jgi:hypothetical protein
MGMKSGPERILSASDRARLHRAGSAWTDLGSKHLASGEGADWAASARCHRRAIELLGELGVDEDSSYLADLGAAWVNLGCALQAGSTRESLGEALDAFDCAIGLLGRLPLGAHPRFDHNLAAAWMNRADAFAGTGTATGHASALDAYARAIEIAQGLPLDGKLSFRILLASCWINHGNLCQRLLRIPEALHSYDGAVAALGNLPGTGHRASCHHAATAWTNRGEALLSTNAIEGAAAAVESAGRALALVEGRDLGGPVDAKLRLRALRVLARGRESLLRRGTGGGVDAVAQLTDAAERGLDLAFGGHEKDPWFFDPFIVWFFSFGSRIYGHYQPQFLKEFLDETLGRWDPRGSSTVGSELIAISRQATAGALEVLGRNRLLVAGTRRTELVLGTVRQLRGAAFQFNP